MRIALATAVLLAAGACSGSSGDDGPPPAPDATSILCDSGGGEPFDLSVGYLASDSDFVELADGDDATLILGAQGILMLHLETRAFLSFADDNICFTCSVGVGPTDAGFAGTEQDGVIGMVEVSAGAFGGAINVLLGSPSASDAFADSEADVTMDCNGNGFSGSVERQVVLRLPPS